MKLKNIYGHELIRRNLAKILNDGAANGSWIFSGPSGIGKRTLACIFTAHILSGRKPASDILDFYNDDTLDRVFKNTHPDLLFTDSYKNDNSIDFYRDMMAKIYRKPVLSKHRVFIIDGAENLNINVSNALLKIFEEPPANTVMILVTTNADVIPVTLRSRCSILNFSRLSYDNVKNALAGSDKKTTDEVVLLANGSVGDAIKLADSDIYDQFLDLVKSFSKKKLSSFILNYDLSEHWWAVKICINRYLTCLLNKSLNIEIVVLPKEKEATSQHISSSVQISEVLEKIIKIISNVDNMKLDKMVFLYWFFEKLSSLR